MFDNRSFEKWLQAKADAAFAKVGTQETLSQSEILILVLKAQTNHIHHMGEHMQNDMVSLNEGVSSLQTKLDVRSEACTN